LGWMGVHWGWGGASGGAITWMVGGGGATVGGSGGSGASGLGWVGVVVVVVAMIMMFHGGVVVGGGQCDGTLGYWVGGGGLVRGGRGSSVVGSSGCHCW